MNQIRGGLWPYAVKIYTQPRVSDCCIALQDRLGVNVCLVLAMIWLAARGRCCTTASTEILAQCAADWDAVLAPLRIARRALRQRSASLYAEAGQLELAVERQLLLALEGFIDAMALPSESPSRALTGNLAELMARGPVDADARALWGALQQAVAIPGWDRAA